MYLRTCFGVSGESDISESGIRVYYVPLIRVNSPEFTVITALSLIG